MRRAERLRKVGALLATQEHRARQAMAAANDDLRRATDGVQAVLEQCWRIGQPGGDRAHSGNGQHLGGDHRGGEPELPARASAAIVQAGLREATERAAAREAARAVAVERRQQWQQASSRQEAVGRLADRAYEEERREMRKRSDDELDDVITARGSRTRPVRSDEEGRR